VTRMIVLMLAAPNVQGQVSFTGQELLARPTDHSITLNVVASSALDAYIEYGTTSGDYTSATSTVSQAANEPTVIVIDGLSADTKYYYRLRYRVSGSGGAFSARSEHTFHTQRPAGSTFTFDITSDSHVNILLGNAATWQQTLTNVANDNPDFLLDLGDTFAMDGVSSQAAADTSYIFQRRSTTFGLISPSVPIFIAVGNHENQEGWHLNDNSNPANTEPVWGTNAQKRYFPNPVPNDFYTGNTDTYSALDGDHLHEDYYAWAWGDALFVVIDPFWYTKTKPFIAGGNGEAYGGSGNRWDWTLGDTQYWWLKNTLENSNAKYKFLFMHHPTGGTDDYIRGGAYAGTYVEWGGYNEDSTTWGFTTNRPTWPKPIHQILIDNGVSAVFHGHDHQYGYEKRDGTVYQELPSAGFSGPGFSQYSTGPYRRYVIKALNSPGHLRVTVSPTQTTVDYVNSTNVNGSNGSVAYSYTVLPTSITVNTKIFLQGPYNGSSMNTALNAYLPTSQPYRSSPWSYSGSESVASGFFASHTDIVDWVLVELRTGTAASTEVAARAAFLTSNGTIVELDATSPVLFTGKAAGDYYIVIRHRNHLAVMSAGAVSLSSSSILYDFTTAQTQAYGTNPMAALGSDKFGMFAGDGNADGGVYAEDYTLYQTGQGNVGYQAADYNLDGGVYAEDYTLYRVNQGKETQVR
jgi:hypothetical protein